MSEWRETPEHLIVLAELADGTRIRFQNLKVGDCFRTVSPVDPTSHLPSEQWFMACDAPRHADGTETPQDFGWCLSCVPVDGPKSSFH